MARRRGEVIFIFIIVNEQSYNPTLQKYVCMSYVMIITNHGNHDLLRSWLDVNIQGGQALKVATLKVY